MWAKHCAITLHEWSESYLTHGLLWCPLPLIDFSSLQWNIKVSFYAPQSVSWVIQLSLNYYFSLYQGRAYILKSIKCKRYIFIVIYLLLLPLHLVRARLHTCSHMCVAERQNMWQCDVHMCAPLCAIHQFEWVCVHECVWASLPACLSACMCSAPQARWQAWTPWTQSLSIKFLLIKKQRERNKVPSPGFHVGSDVSLLSSF